MLTFEEWTSWLMYQQLFAQRGGQQDGKGMGAAGGSTAQPGPFLFSMRGIGMLFLSPLNRKMQLAFGLNPGTKAITAGADFSKKIKRRNSDPSLQIRDIQDLSGPTMKSHQKPSRKHPFKRGDSKTAEDLDLLQSPDTDESDTESDYNFPTPPPASRGTRFVPLGVINPESGFVPIVVKTQEDVEQPMPNTDVKDPEVKQVVPVTRYSRVRAEHFAQWPGSTPYGYSPFGRRQSDGRVNFASMCAAVNDAFQKQKESSPDCRAGGDTGKYTEDHRPQEHIIQPFFPSGDGDFDKNLAADLEYGPPREENDSGYWDVSRGQESSVSTREPSPQLTSTPVQNQPKHLPSRHHGIPPQPNMGNPSFRPAAYGGLPTFGQRMSPGFGGTVPGFSRSFHSSAYPSGPIDIPSTRSSLTIQEISGSPANSETTLVGSPSGQSIMSAVESDSSPVPVIRTVSVSETVKPEQKLIKPKQKTPVTNFAHPAMPGADFSTLYNRHQGPAANVTRSSIYGRNIPQASVPNGNLDHTDFERKLSQPRDVHQVMYEQAGSGVSYDTPLYTDTSLQVTSSPVILSPDGSVDSQAVVPLTQDLSLAIPKKTTTDVSVKPKVALDPNVEEDMTVAVREAAGNLAIPTTEPWVLCAAVPKTSDASSVKEAVDKGAIIALPASQAAAAMNDLDVSTDGSDSTMSFMVDEDTQTLADDDMFSFYEMEMQDYAKFPDWMSKLPENLHDIPLTKLTIPGSHISLAIEGDMRTDMDFSKCNLEMLDILSKLPDFAIFNSFRKQMKKIWKSWMPKQLLSVYQQLEAGSRYLDIQLAKFKKHYYGEHGLYTREFHEYLQQLKDFLESNPKEVVILHFKKLESYTRKDKRQLLTDLFQMFGRKLCSSDFLDKLTLSNLWAAQKQLVLIFPKGDTDLFKGHIFDRFVLSDEILITSRIPKKQTAEDLVDELDDDYEDLIDDDGNNNKFHLMFSVLAPDLNMVFGEFKYKCMGDLIIRETVPVISDWLVGKANLNIVIVDFIGGGDIVNTILSLNKAKEEHSCG